MPPLKAKPSIWSTSLALPLLVGGASAVARLDG